MIATRCRPALLLAAALAPVAPAQPGASPYPLEHGNLWVYRSDFSPVPTVSVEASEKVGGVRCARLTLMVGGRKAREERLAWDKQGLSRHRLWTPQGEARITTPVLRLRLPVTNGDRWTSVTGRSLGRRPSDSSPGRQHHAQSSSSSTLPLVAAITAAIGSTPRGVV